MTASGVVSLISPSSRDDVGAGWGVVGVGGACVTADGEGVGSGGGATTSPLANAY